MNPQNELIQLMIEQFFDQMSVRTKGQRKRTLVLFKEVIAHMEAQNG